MTSGTLAYSFALGKAIVSTPYWHAERIAGRRTRHSGPVCQFRGHRQRDRGIADRPSATAGHAQARLFGRPVDDLGANRGALPDGFRKCAARASAQGDCAARPKRGLTRQSTLRRRCGPDHLLSMCDDTGLFQHAVHSVPDRAHGYCVDDNARALLLACALNGPGEQRLPEALTARFAAFVQHAWNPDTKRFRNFMSFDRRWLEDRGSEDSHGRTLWALGECARGDASESRRRWATGFVRRSVAGGGELQLAARMGLHAARAGRLLRRDRRGFRRQAYPAAPRRQIDVHPVGRRDEGLGLVRGRAFLRQRAFVPGADRHGTFDRDADLCRGGLAIPALADDAADDAGRPVPACRYARDSASSARRRRRSISSRWRPRRRSRPALRHGAPMAIPRGEPTRRVHSPGSSAATI